MIEIKVSIDGVFDRTIEALRKRLGERFEVGARQAANLLLQEAKRATPADTMTLRDTARVRQEGSGLDAVFVVGFGPYGITNTGVYSPHEGKKVNRIPAHYAIIIHQAAGPTMGIHAVGYPFFLLTAVDMNLTAMTQIIVSQWK